MYIYMCVYHIKNGTILNVYIYIYIHNIYNLYIYIYTKYIKI